jgi:hypothetical protein
MKLVFRRKTVFRGKTIFQRVVYLVAGLALGLDALALADFILHPLATDHTFYSSIYRGVIVLVMLPLNLLIAFLVIKRVPGNIVGPLLIVWSGSVAFSSMREEIGLILFSLGAAYEILFGWIGLFLMFLHFPDGKIFPLRVTRWVYPQLGINLLMGLFTFLSMKQLQAPSRAAMANPFFLPVLGKYASVMLVVGLIIFLPLLVLVVVSTVLRYQSGGLLERQQVKWLAFSAILMIIYTIPGMIVYPLLAGKEVMSPGTNIFGLAYFIFSYMMPAATIGIAVLRYRLWDIDRIIRRTLAYTILTVIITVTYFGAILTLQTLFTSLFQAATNTLAIVLSTLVIAAIFTPLRRRIQSGIDRRFFRKRYDPERILADFTANTRREVAVEPIASQLLHNIEDTMQPEEMSLWLQEAGRREF